jgi:hypothetical protein
MNPGLCLDSGEFITAAELNQRIEMKHELPLLARIADLDAQLASGQEPVAWRWSESSGKRWFSLTTDWTDYDQAKSMGCMIEFASPAPAPAPAQQPWIEVTQELLNSQADWLYAPMWVALNTGLVVHGVYEWRQGQYPDRFKITNGYEIWAFEASHVMPMVVPPLPLAAHGIKENP